MRCPYCGGLDTQVKDSRPTEDASSIRRRRICPDCGGRFTTFERVQLRELHGGEEERPARAVRSRQARCARSQVALRKRPVAPERIERMINGIVRQLESQGDADIPTERIGELVMEGLKALDDVAYVRFASVYRNFREARDFNAIVGELEAEPEPAPAARPRAQGRAGVMTARQPRDPTRTSAGWTAALAFGARSLGARRAQSVGRRDPGERRRRRRPRRDRAGRAAARRAARARRSRRGRARRDALCHAGAVLASRRDAALRRGGRRGRRRAGRFAIEDPNPRVGGRRATPGCARRGSQSTVGPGAAAGAARPSRPHPARHGRAADGDAEARRNRGRLRGGRRARSLASRITGQTANLRVQVMRSMHDAIMVGVGTAIADDPVLTVRLPGLDRSRCASCSIRICACRRPRASRDRARLPDARHRRPGRVARRRPSALPISASRSSASTLDAGGRSRSRRRRCARWRARGHARVQRGRPAGGGAADCARPRRRGRA